MDFIQQKKLFKTWNLLLFFLFFFFFLVGGFNRLTGSCLSITKWKLLWYPKLYWKLLCYSEFYNLLIIPSLSLALNF